MLLALPLILIIFALFYTPDQENLELVHSLAKDALVNSLLLCFFVGVFSLTIGVGTAWLLSRYEFPMSRFLSKGLLLPLTIPVYIMAYSYSGIFNYAGPLQQFLRYNFDEATAKYFYFDFLQTPFLIACLVLALFPYIFISARVSFSLNSNSFLEAAQSLGASGRKIFFKVALPLARPALAGGLFLVLMELLNDYGAANYFGIRTFTTVIFQAWGFDLKMALFLAALILIFIFLLMSLERWSRGKAKINNTRTSVQFTKQKLKGVQSFLAFTVCFIPFLFGFLIPFSYLIYGLINLKGNWFNERFLQMSLNSFSLAAMAAFAVVLIGLIIAYNQQLHRFRISRFLNQLATVGYAIPGAVIAVAVFVPAGIIDNWLVAGQVTKSLFLTGSIFLLIYAYTIRFLAVAYQPLESSLQKNAKTMHESARSLGKNSWYTLFKIEIPNIQPAIWAAVILVFVDVLKELPLTLILRPFNFDTLATETYRYAKVMESIPESAASALIIIIIGMLPILFLHRLISKNL